jgi:hypothetical protein
MAVIRLEEDGSTRTLDLKQFGGPLPLQNPKVRLMNVGEEFSFNTASNVRCKSLSLQLGRS